MFLVPIFSKGDKKLNLHVGKVSIGSYNFVKIIYHLIFLITVPRYYHQTIRLTTFETVTLASLDFFFVFFVLLQGNTRIKLTGVQKLGRNGYLRIPKADFLSDSTCGDTVVSIINELSANRSVQETISK